MEQRERFSSRMGFLFLSAGCAIGLGNVWRFPSVAGRYGGAAFVAVYLFFLAVLGLPIMVMEFAVGRASQRSIAGSFQALEPPGTKWHLYSAFGMAGNYLLMMFYTPIAGWMLSYLLGTARGDFVGLDAVGVEAYFGAMLEQPLPMALWTALVVALGFGICALGLQNGVERVTKWMMSCLFAVMLLLAVRSVTLPGAAEGLRFYLVPDFAGLAQGGLGEAVSAAMGQAFFTLSLGLGGMAIFGSYIGRERRLTGEAINITLLDTAVAIVSGLIIFPASFAFGIKPDAGASLIFITLPNVFNSMPGGRFWGSLFFVFMTFAALSTVIAVFQNLLSYSMDKWGWSRSKAVIRNLLLVTLLAMPCVLGYNLWSGFAPLGPGTTVLDLEDFLVSNNIMPLGSLVYLFFCTSRYGWGWGSFIGEADAGRGVRFPQWARVYVRFILPLIVLFIFIQGYVEKFAMVGS